MKKFTLVFLSGLLFSVCLRAQTAPAPYVPNIIPPSPNASVLMKFAEVPVSPYTGASDFSVPIYTIQAKGLNIPVELSYHTGGIRLSEESGIIGLGWALVADATISRTIHDKDDFLSIYFGPTSVGDLSIFQPANSPAAGFNFNKYMIGFNCNQNVSFLNGETDSLSNLFINPNTFDAELDTYTYNIFGKSGKFFITHAGVVVMQKQDNIIINLIHKGNYTFQVTDESGNNYYFEYPESYFQHSSGNSQLSSWHISTVITQQKDTVSYTYTTPDELATQPDRAETYREGCAQGGWTYNTFSQNYYDNVNLQTIDFKSGRVKFYYSATNRHDIVGANELDSIQVYSKTTAGLKYLKSHKLYYDYFNPTDGNPADSLELKRLRLDSVKEVSNGIPLPAYKFSYNDIGSPYPQKHGFAVDHWGYYNGKGNTTFVPTNNSFLVPSAGGQISSPQGLAYFSFSGANREPDTNYMKSMALVKVTYPTGGSTTFDYDANYYDYTNSINGPLEYRQMVTIAVDTTINMDQYGTHSGTIDFSKIASTIVPPFTGVNAHVDIAYISALGTGWPSSVRNTSGKLNCSITGPSVNVATDIGDTDLSCSGRACSFGQDVTVSQASATAFTWHTYVDSSIPTTDFSEIHIRVTFTGIKVVATQNPTLMGGGLRIRAIADYSSAGTIAKKRTWDYGYGSSHQYTFGRLMSFPVYAYGEFLSGFQGEAGGICQDITLFSSSITSLTSVTSGNSVGYSSVTEYTIDSAHNANNGKIVYVYYNSPDTTISYDGLRPPGVLNMGNNLNGELFSKTTYSNHSGLYWKVGETDNVFQTTNRQAYYTLKWTDWHAINNNDVGCSTNPNIVIHTYLGYFYPFFKSERVLLDSSRNVVYDQNDTTKFLASVTTNYYDNPKHYYPTRIKAVDSKGNKHVSKITYPQDYITSGSLTGNTILDSLIRRNMVGETIEKRDSLYLYTGGAGKVIAASESRYKQLSSGTMVHDKEYKLEAVKPITDFVPMSISGNTYSQDSRYRQLISFDKYDNANNIAQYTPANELPVSIIWDYHKTSPIAQVKNADTLSIAYTSFEADGMGGWTIPSAARDAANAMTGAQSYNLSSGSVSKGGLISTNTYVISYWTKNVSPLTLTGTVTGYPIKGATINGWTYYEHKVTGIATATLTGTGNIDELRLYPQNAQMTSYTYTPGVGVTTISDARGGINYYEYDAFQRLLDIKDQNGNIVKSFVYHYAGQ